MIEHKIATIGAITSDIAERPDSLLLNVLVVRAEQLDENWQSAGVDDASGLHGVARSDVGECPGGLELQVVVVALQELDELGHDARVDDLVDGRVGLFGEELAETLRDVELLLFRAEHQQLDHFWCDYLHINDIYMSLISIYPFMFLVVYKVNNKTFSSI